jgi:hypothetical protein
MGGYHRPVGDITFLQSGAWKLQGKKKMDTYKWTYKALTTVNTRAYAIGSYYICRWKPIESRLSLSILCATIGSLEQHQSLCSAELISTAYQPWNSVFLSQQISHSRLIRKKKERKRSWRCDQNRIRWGTEAAACGAGVWARNEIQHRRGGYGLRGCLIAATDCHA